MSTLEIIGLIAACLTSLGIIITAAVKISAYPYERKITKLKKENYSLREKNDGLTESLKIIKTAVNDVRALHEDIETELQCLARLVSVESASVLIPFPTGQKKWLAFLSATGPAASRLKYMCVEAERSTAGDVLSKSVTRIVNHPVTEQNWNSMVDKKSLFTTEQILCSPLRTGTETIGVVQFLNKENGFTEADAELVEKASGAISRMIGRFIQDESNLEILGLSRAQDKPEDGAAITVDLSASSSLLKMAHPVSRQEVVGLINEYLENITDVGLKYGCIIDKFMWDGCLFSLNVSRKAADHKRMAFQAAVDIVRKFEDMKSSWLRVDYPVSRIFVRVAIASGPIYQVELGPPQYRQRTIVGDPVVISSVLCQNAARNKNIIIVDESMRSTLSGMNVKMTKADMSQFAKIHGMMAGAYYIDNIPS